MRRLPLVLVAATLTLIAGTLVRSACAATAPPMNVVFVLVDALRADALGPYGQTLPTSPNLDAFAKEAVVYDRAWTQYTWTIPSFISFMSSRYARSHGWDFPFQHKENFQIVDNRAPFLAEELTAAGYRSAAFNASPTVQASLGLSRGFTSWHDGRNDANLTTLAIQDLQTWKTDGKPNFLYLHLMSCHIPLIPSKESAAAIGLTIPYDPKLGIGYGHWIEAPEADKPQRMIEFRQAYMAGARDADANIGRVLAALDTDGLRGETAVFVAADHGELLGEHGLLGHNGTVWEELTRVPLMMRIPGVAPRREKTRFGRLMDIAPTILELAHRPMPSAWQGMSLLAPGTPKWIVSERENLLVITDGKIKNFEDRQKERFLASVDLAADPHEANFRKDTTLPGVQALIDSTKLFRTTIPVGKNVGLSREQTEAQDAEERAMLESLGYIQK
jgi:arylsulfatase A-like enzyme